jgi:hypothetical protein
MASRKALRESNGVSIPQSQMLLLQDDDKRLAFLRRQSA